MSLTLGAGVGAASAPDTPPEIAVAIDQDRVKAETGILQGRSFSHWSSKTTGIGGVIAAIVLVAAVAFTIYYKDSSPSNIAGIVVSVLSAYLAFSGFSGAYYINSFVPRRTLEEEVSRAEEKTKQLEGAVLEKAKMLVQMQQEIDELRKTAAAITHEREELTQTVKGFQAERESLHKESESVKAQLAGALKEREVQIRLLDAFKEALFAKLDTLEQTRDDLADDLRDFKLSIGQFGDSVDRVAKAAKTLDSSDDIIADAAHELSDTQVSLQKQVSELTELLSAKDCALCQLERQRDDLEQRTAELQRLLEDLQKLLATYDEREKLMLEKVQASESRIKEMVAVSSQKDETIAYLRSELESMQHNSLSLRDAISQSDVGIRDLRAAVQEALTFAKQKLEGEGV